MIEKYWNKNKDILTLPVPIGTILYKVQLQCSDICLFQKEKYEIAKKQTAVIGCIGSESLCHTREGAIIPIELTLKNISILDLFEITIFKTKKEATAAANTMRMKNMELAKSFNFTLDENGYAIKDEVIVQT